MAIEEYTDSEIIQINNDVKAEIRKKMHSKKASASIKVHSEL